MVERGRPSSSWRECSKKHALSLSEGSIQLGRSPFDARSVLSVREHGKMARTPLAAFFNIPSNHSSESFDIHRFCAGFSQRFCAFIDGRSGGKDIIHK